MAQMHETTMSLRFFGDKLDPEEITARFNCLPSESSKKGDVKVTKRGDKKVAPTGMWLLKVRDQQPGDLDIQVAELLDVLSDDVEVWADLTTRFDASLFLRPLHERD